MSPLSQPTTFRALHATWYDLFHQRKAYQSEVDQIRLVLGRAADDTGTEVRSILDLGCGTARHLDLLATGGHDVVGVDRSPAMVAAAQARLARHGPRAEVVEGDLFEVALGRTFDAVTMMFGLLSYQVANETALAALASAHRHLRPGGFLVFDVLDAMTALGGVGPGGLAVITEEPQQLLCAYSERLNAEQQLVELSLRMWLLEQGQLVDQDQELHPLRFFLHRELELLLRAAGFALLGSAPLDGEAVPPGSETFRLVWATRM